MTSIGVHLASIAKPSTGRHILDGWLETVHVEASVTSEG